MNTSYLSYAPSTFTNPTTGEDVSVTFEYDGRYWPTERYRVTLDKPVLGDEAEEALVEHIGANHVYGATFDYWVDDEHTAAQFTVDASIYEG